MKEMDSLESRFAFLSAASPVAETVRLRLFAAPASLMPKVAWAAWLAGNRPRACVLLTFSAFNPENARDYCTVETMTAMIFSNQNYAAYASDNFKGTENRLSSVTFDWTNHSGFPV